MRGSKNFAANFLEVAWRLLRSSGVGDGRRSYEVGSGMGLAGVAILGCPVASFVMLKSRQDPVFFFFS